MADTVERGFPPGPWVLVLGMHRSGTSALTGALGHLGLALPAPGDLVTGHYDNPVHYESQALTDVNDDILRALGGTWSAPPRLDPDWERSPAVLKMQEPARSAAAHAFPFPGPIAWKDPRLSLLLPFWRSVLPQPVATVLLWRAPLAAARSLRFRQGFTTSLGLALWERYTRDTLTALAGSKAYILRYEELLGDPGGLVGALARWLRDEMYVPLDAEEEQIAMAASSVSTPLARQEGQGELPEVIGQTVATLTSLSGGNGHVPEMEMTPAPSWMDDVIAQRREYEELYGRYMRYVRWRRRIPILGRRVAGRGGV